MTDPIPPRPAAAPMAEPVSATDAELARLRDLNTRLIDTLEGYHKVIEKAEPEFLGVAQEFRRLHKTQQERVGAMLLGLGEAPEEEGSLQAAVNRAVVTVRSWFDDIGHNILDGLVDGEKRLLADVDAAIAAATDPARRDALDAIRAEIVGAVRRHAPGAL